MPNLSELTYDELVKLREQVSNKDKPLSEMSLAELENLRGSFTSDSSTNPKPSMYQNVYDAFTMETGRPEPADVVPAKPIIPTISTLTPELRAKSRSLTNQEQKYLTTQKNIELAQKYPKNYYTGVSGQMESFGKGLLPTSKESPPDIEQAYPITHAAGQLAGLAGTALLTRGIAPAVTTAKTISTLPTIARMAAGKMAQTGATFGIKEFIDNMAEMYAGKDKSSGEVIKKTLKSTAFGVGLGLVGTPASPFMRIPAEMGYGYMTAKIEGADDLHAGINAGMFGLFGLLNAKNLSEAYKIEAYNGSKRALVDRLMAKGADEDKASRIADKYFQYAMGKTGGWENSTIKDFDAFSKAMKKGWDIAKEGEEVGTAGSGGITDTPLIPPSSSTEPPTTPSEPYGPSDILPQELQVTPQQKLIKKPDTTVTDYMQDRGEITPIQLATHGLLSMTPTEMKADLKTRLSTAGIGPTGLGIVDDMDITRPSDIKPMLDAIDKALNGASKEVKTELNKTKIALKYWNSEQFGKLVNKNRDIINQIKDELISGNPGTRIRDYSVQGQGGTPDVIGIPSTYPEYFRGKGLTASDVIGYIDIIQGGGKLAEGQQATIEDLIRDKRAHVITEVKSVIDERRQIRRQTEQIPAGYLNVGDTFNIKGEKHQVIGEDADGNKIIQNGTTITADPFDQVPIDKGLKGVKNKPVPKEVMPSAKEETSKVSEDAKNAEERLLTQPAPPPAPGEDVSAAEFGLETPVTETLQVKFKDDAGKEAKQPWEMTREEWLKSKNSDLSPDKPIVIHQHKKLVIQALERGKHIPVEVLNLYPELSELFQEKEPARDYEEARKRYRGISLGAENSIASNALSDLLAFANTPKGREHVKSEIGKIDKNDDGTITVYRVGKYRQGKPMSVTIEKATADLISSERTRQGLDGEIFEFNINPDEINAAIGGFERELIITKSAKQQESEAPPAPVNAVPESPKPQIFEHPEIKPTDKINAITREQAGHMIADGDPAVIKHIKEGVDALGKPAMQDAIRNQEMIEIAKAHKGAEREAVKEHIQQIEPEINKALTGEKKLSIGLQIDHPLSKAVSEGLKEISTNPYIAQIAKNVGLKKVVVGKPYTFEFTQEGGVNKYGEIHLNPDAVDVNETFLHELGHMVTSSFDTEQSNRLVKAVSKHYDLLNKIAPGYMRDFAEGHPEEALAHFFSLFDKLPPDVQSIMLEKPNKPRTYQVRPTEAGKVPVNLKPKKIESWDKMRETGGYIDPDHDLQGIINKYGDTWLGIKDVNGGRHMMKASDFIKLEQNEVAYNYVRSVYTVADGYTGKKEFRLDPDITRLTFAKAVAEVFPDKVDKFPDNIKKNPEFIKALKGNKAEVPKPQEPVKMSKEESFKKALEAKANKALNVPIRHNGKVKTKRQMVDDVINYGGHPEIKEVADMKAKDNASELIRYIRSQGDQNIRAKDIAEAMKIIENPPIIKKYRLVNNDGSFLDISKTEYDYAAAKEIEPEINKELKGEVPEAPSYDEYVRKESGRGTNLDYEIRYAKELRDQANKNSEWMDRNVKSFFPAEMKWNVAGNARLKELADNQEKYVKSLQRVQPVSEPEPDITSLTKDRGALIPKSMSNKDRTIATLGKVGTTIQFGVPGFNKDHYTITDINDSGDIKISGEKTYRSPTDFKRADIPVKSIGTPENINTIALSDILLKSLQEGEQLNKVRILGITAKALNVPVSDLKNHKSIDEAMEYAIVKRAREILRVVGVDHYQEMKNLYNQQPNLTVRTSTSITNQAYSTPVPLAYLMDKYLNITPQDKVYEPTAGNGMLVIGANPENTWVNEIDKKRSEHLNDAGYRMVTNNDASKEYKQGHKTVDVSVMNPPFGIAEQKTYDGFKISKLEHQIAIEALNAMKDRGRAAIIIGGHNFKNGNMVESDRIFLNYLYSHYNVTHNIDIDGDIYRKMGASYPIRLITVNGRKTTPDTQYAPTKEQIESAMNFDRVKEILEKPVEKGIVKAEQGVIHDNVQSVRGSVGAENKGVAGKGEAAGVSGVVTTERKPIREEQRPAARRGSRTDVGTERAGIDGGVPEAAIRPVHKEGIRPLDVTVGISQQQSGVKASGVSDLSESDFDSLINEVSSEGQEPTISEETSPYGEDFDVKRYEKVKPYFAQVLDEFTKQDKTVKEFIKHVLDKYNESIVPYLKAFHRDISTKAVKQEIPSNEFQVPYKPQSKAEAGDNLIPKNMVEPARKALKELSDKVGDIDDYVKNKLGYTSDKDFQSAFSAEQIDGLAMAINAIDNGQAIIVGDQTGVGKGRQAAGVIRYANKLGKKPIFFTATPKLFSDIYRDLVDIGYPIVPFIMHTDATKASVYDEDGNKIFKPSGNPAVYKQMVNDVDAIMSKYEAIVLPYSQIRTKNIQQQIINQLAKDNIIILDESHMASGESETGNFVRHILKEAKGALYLSATYAKRPDTMPLYYRTKLGASKMSINDLVSAVNNGGVLLQQYIANGLSGMGQMIRRELNYSGVKFEVEVDTDNFEQDSRKADDITDILRQIVAWDGKKQLLIDAMDKQAKAAGGRMMGKQQAAASVTSSNFAATVHNNISQLLLGLKADATVNRAIQALKEGKKPFIGVMNTMESFLEHMVKEQGASVGEPIGFTFRDVLKKSLTGTLRYSVTDAMGDKTYDVLKVDEMPGEFQSAYRSIESDIDTLDTSVPASPIDYIKNKISEAGYKVDEITGRTYYIDYSKKIPVLAKRSQREISDRNAPVNNFNSGKTDALIVNAAGSTGLSIHSSSKFKDQRQRKGIIAQADLNIDTFMQLLGRINRKGQVNLPEYTILQTALPAEIRPAIVLSKKMSSLNANISANKNSATTMKDIPEMMNHYGDKVVIDYLMDNSNVNDMLGDPLGLKGKVGKEIPEDAFKKASGRMALLPVEVQKDFYAQIESDYVNLIDYLDQIGENNLEAKDYNFEAKALEKTQIYKGTDESNPFTSDTYLEKVSVKVLRQPYNTAKIKELIVDKTSDQHYQGMVVGLKRDAEAYKETLKKKQTLLGRIFGKGTTGVDDDMDYVASRLSRFRIGNTYDVAVTGDYVIPGVLIDVKRHKGDGSPVAPSKISLVFAVSDSTQIITMPLSKKLELSATHQTSEGIARNWDSLSATSNRETRYIVTGNLVQGFDRLSQKAEIVNYTTDTGDRKQGILIPKSIKDAEVRLASTSVSHEDVYNILRNNRDIDIVTTNSEASVNMDRDGDLTVVVPKSKLSGAKYFLNDKIRDLVNNREFQSVGSKMRAFVPADSVKEFLKVFEEETNIRFAIPKRLMGGKDEFTIAEQAAGYGEPLTVNEITAYHGSPYRFDKFSSEKIGTGEGAQAFGHGLYFTDEEDIAKHYAIDRKEDFVEKVLWAKKEHLDLWEKAKVELFREEGFIVDDYKVLRRLEKYGIKIPLFGKKNVYSVTLHKGKAPEQYEYLRWDENTSLNQQQKIREQFRKENIEVLPTGTLPGQNVYKSLSNYLGGDSAASDFLLRAGIDGIKYPSGSLSGKKSDKFNYVVFDPKAVTIESVGEKRTAYNRRPDYDQQTYNKAKTRLDKISSESGGVGDRGRDNIGIKTLGVAIRRDLLQKGRVDLRGQTVNNTEDIAIVSQVFRSPQFETFRIGYVRDGVIVGMDGVSSRMPGVSSVFLQGDKSKHLFNILDRAKRLGADSFYFLHNHPSGKPAPSQGDMETTASIVGRLKKMADRHKMRVPKFISHVIINSGKYAVIDYDVIKPNEMVVQEFKLPTTGEDILLTAEKTNEYLTSKISMPDDIVRIGQALKQPENFVTVIYRGSDSMVRAIEAMPINQFLSKDVAGILRNRARAYGGRDVFTYYDKTNDKYFTKSQELLRSGVLADAIESDKSLSPRSSRHPANQWMGITTDKTTVRVAEEEKKYGITEPMAQTVNESDDNPFVNMKSLLRPAGISDKDITTAERLYSLPWWLSKKHSEYKKQLAIEMTREESREKLVHELISKSNNSDEVNEFIALPRKSADAVFKIIVQSDIDNTTYLQPNAKAKEATPYLQNKANEIIGRLLTNKEMNGYYAWKRVMDRAFDKIFEYHEKLTYLPFADKPWVNNLKDVVAGNMDIEKAVEGLSKPEQDAFHRAHEKIAPSVETITQLRAEMGRIKFYVPRERAQGEYAVRVYDNEGKVVWHERAVTQWGAARIAKRLSKERGLGIKSVQPTGKMTGTKNYIVISLEKGTPESLYQSISDAAIQRFIDNSITKAVDRKTIDPTDASEILDALNEVVAEHLKSRGFGKHMIKRSDTDIGGYQTVRGKEVMFNYVTSLAGFLTKQEAAINFTKALFDVPQEKPQLFDELSQYTKDMLRNSELLDRVSGKARAIAFTYYLAGNLKSAAVQFTQNFVTGMPYLARQTKWASAKYVKSMADTTMQSIMKTILPEKYMKAMEDTAISRYTKEETQALHDAIIRGVTSAQYTKEITGHIASKFGNAYRKTAAVLAYPFMEMEVFNRKSAFIAMFRAQKAKGATYEDAWKSAEEFVYDAHFLYGKANLPGFARGGSTAAIGLKTLYTFRAFNHNYLLAMQNAFRKSDIKMTSHGTIWSRSGAGGFGVLGRSLAWLVLFGGLASLPFLNSLLDFLEKHTGTPYRTNLRDALKGFAGKTFERVGMSGLPALLGIDISGSLEIGAPVIGDIKNDVYGVWGGMTDKVTHGAQYFWTEQYYRGIESWSPTFWENWMKAGRLAAEGFTTPTGKPMFNQYGEPLKLTPPEALKQGFGFKSARISEENQRNRVKSNVKAYQINKQSDIRTILRTQD